MDGQYSWKRTEDIEIDLVNLLRRFLGQWKQIVICALAFAAVFGGYRWMKNQHSMDAVLPETAEEAVLTEVQEQAVMDAVCLKNEISGMEAYLEQSVLMNLDPYQKARYVMLYRIDYAENQKLALIADSYVNFILNGGAADALKESDSGRNLDKICLSELVSAYQKTYTLPYQLVSEGTAASGQLTETFFYIEITGENASAAEKMASDMKEVLKKHSEETQKIVGSHRLKLISSTENIIADNALQAQQHERKSLLSTNKTNLRAMLDAFSIEQMAVYLKAAGEVRNNDMEESREDASGENIIGNNESGTNLKSVVKYMFLGLTVGIFIYGSIFICWYLFSDTVKSIGEMKRMYVFPVYGAIRIPFSKRKKERLITEVFRDTCKKTQIQAFSRVRLACRRQGLAKLYAAADFTLCAAEKECLQSMVLQMKTWGIHMSVAEKVSTDEDIWDSLSETGNVLMICRLGTVTHQMIDDTMNFYLENGISVIGAAVFSE